MLIPVYLISIHILNIMIVTDDTSWALGEDQDEICIAAAILSSSWIYRMYPLQKRIKALFWKFFQA